MCTVDANIISDIICGYSIPIAISAGASLQVGHSVVAAIFKLAEVPFAIEFINMAQLGGTTVAVTIARQVFQLHAFKNAKHLKWLTSSMRISMVLLRVRKALCSKICLMRSTRMFYRLLWVRFRDALYWLLLDGQLLE